MAPLSVRDAWAVVVLMAAGLAVAMASIANRHGVSLGLQFLFDDEGHNLLIVHEEASFIEALNRTVALIYCNESDGDDQQQAGTLDPPFPPLIAKAVRSKLTPWKSEAGRVYHVR